MTWLARNGVINLSPFCQLFPDKIFSQKKRKFPDNIDLASQRLDLLQTDKSFLHIRYDAEKSKFSQKMLTSHSRHL